MNIEIPTALSRKSGRGGLSIKAWRFRDGRLAQAANPASGEHLAVPNAIAERLPKHIPWSGTVRRLDFAL